MTKFLTAFSFLIFSLAASAQQKSRPVPTTRQMEWHDMEFYWFIHFGPNTFTDKEWGHGDEPEDVFNPTQLDCRQWARIAKQSGAKGIIITAKHHDGFCLWPSKYSTHTVRESKWKNGKGDVLKELKDACKEYGLKFGVYLSPWDRNHPKYGTPEYNDVYVNTMKELITNYGPFFEFWWDGANGEGPNGKKQVYDFPRFEKTIRKLAPNTIVFSDIGPDIRWVGNEKGIAGKTNWNYLDTAGFKRGLGAPPNDTLTQGNVFGKNWIPAECDVSIRPGWFYHPEEDSKVKTGEQLFDLYLKSVGRGANLLLNIPPNRNGLISPEDSSALVNFKKLRDKNFNKNLLANSSLRALKGKGDKTLHNISVDYLNGKTASIDVFRAEGISLKVPTEMNCVVINENLKEGQAVSSFSLLLFDENKKLIREIQGTTIGHKRILSFPRTKISSIDLFVTGQLFSPKSVNTIDLHGYLIDDKLVEEQQSQ